MTSLYIVATPIGNLDDLSIRAQKTLNSVDVILAEDTRVSKYLLQHYSIPKHLKPYHDFNKEKITPHIIESILDGNSHALITDAGTPGIADPAYYLVRAAVRHEIPIIPIPGPTAFVTALIASGLPCDRFIFENFIPNSKAKRQKLFHLYAHEKKTIIVYESPYRICKFLKDLDEVYGDIATVVARELTKKFEDFQRGSPQTILNHFNTHKPRGEFVILFNPNITSDYFTNK